LTKLNDSDIYDKKHILRLLGQFINKGHLCIVFELLDLNLRDTLTLYGKKVGLSLAAVRSYAYQLFIALYHLKKNKIVHLDSKLLLTLVKPDNLMITQNKKKLKLIDFGNALMVDDIPRISELLARFYKAPDVLLGYSFDYGIDMWSAACSIFELYTGCILFNGRSDNEMVKQIMELRGGFTQRLLKKGLFVQDHFDMQTNLFLSVETDPITREVVVREMPLGSFKPKDLGYKLGFDMTLPQLPKEQQLFKDLLDKCLSLDPDRRMTPEEALRHPFFKKQGSKKTN
jgi:serine/threonine-protein kinase PRP4